MAKKKPRKPSQFSEKTIIKREFIARTLKNYGHHLLGKETKILNNLFESLTDDLNFWRSLTLPYQLNSLAFLKQERGWELLNDEYKKYKFVPVEREEIKLSDTNFFLEDQKSKISLDGGAKIEDNKPNMKKSLKDQLNLW